MAIESQNIEFKESWRDEYQKWICGFANAQGGTLYIGLRDNGEVCNVHDAKKLMEDIPNKVRDMMGIMVDVNLKEKDKKAYLEIVTEAYPYPVSFRGKYYQRSGATNQELKGAALDRFMLRKQGKDLGRRACALSESGGLGQCHIRFVPQVCQAERTHGGRGLDGRQSRIVGETPAL